MRRAIAVLLLSCWLPACWAGWFSAQVQQWPLTLYGESNWYRMEVPLGLLSAARDANLSDVRIVDADGKPQPYTLVRQPAENGETRQNAVVNRFALFGPFDDGNDRPHLDVRIGVDGNLIQLNAPTADQGQVRRGWLLEVQAFDAPLSRLLLEWRGEPGFQRFRIEASDDLRHWYEWGEGQVARLEFAGQSVEQREVVLPSRRARYLRLTWVTPRAAPELTWAQVSGSMFDALEIPMAWSLPIAGEDDREGGYRWALPPNLAPERLDIQLTQPNSLAPVQILGRSQAQQSWKALNSGLFYLLEDDGKPMRRQSMTLPGMPLEELMLKVDGRGGGLGKEAPVLRVAMTPLQVVFAAAGRAPYRVVLGDATLTDPQISLERLLPEDKRRNLRRLDVAHIPDDAVYVSDREPWIGDWRHWGLWAILVLGVIALGVMGWSLLRSSSPRG